MKNLRRKLGLAAAMASAIVLVGLIAFVAISRSTATAHADDKAAVREALMKSATSFEKNDVAMASQVWANDESLTVFESGHANYGWVDYRDHHLVPEMGETFRLMSSGVTALAGTILEDSAVTSGAAIRRSRCLRRP